jgi:PII-like signaling protein
MNSDALKLTVYFGERDRTGASFLGDAMLDLFERHRFRTSVLIRGTEGFGIKQRLQTQRLLTLSEDLPIVAVAVDDRQHIETALPEVTELARHGLVTLERARLLSGEIDYERARELSDEAIKLTIYCGRQERVGDRPAFVAVVDFLHRHGVAGATVLLGVDGTVHGLRERARFFSRNAEVPLMIISVGDGDRIGALLPEIGAMFEKPLMTLERVQVLKRDGQKLADLRPIEPRDEAGLARWQKLMIYAGEQARHHKHPLYVELVRRLREARADGATSLRGIWGYHGDHKPHGDKLLAVRRHVPVVTITVDTPERTARWFEIVDELTDETGLVTSEIVPAYRAAGPELSAGGLRLSEPHG